MRGKDYLTDKIKEYYRITPAHAGKSTIEKKQYNPTKDHPRSCGEKFFQLFAEHFFQGSPPLMRGKAKY